MENPHAFGRLVKVDERDKNYPLKQLLPPTTEKTEQYWDFGAEGILDQNGYPACVGFGWASWVDDPPITHPKLIDPMWIYNEAQKIDGFPLPHEGTTVRAGAQVLQSNKVVLNYYWAGSIDEIVMAVLELGPVTVGSNWYAGMSKPDINGTMHVTGALEGGHCYLINGVNTKTGFFRIKNSWGSLWGLAGQAYISITELGNLLALQGEGCLATEAEGDIPTPPPEPACPYARAVSKIPKVGWSLVRGYRKIRKKLFGIEPGNP